jgi:hypothetical protein
VTESPSALLERAAALIEQRAADATPGPWVRQSPDHTVTNIDSSDRQSVAFERDEGACDQEDALWITMLSPVVAPPLVEWLRDAARRMELHPHLSPEGSTMQRTALKFARIVLGEPE